MKKTKALSLLLSLLLLLSSLTLPLLAVDAETAADPEQTQTDSADAPAEDDSVPEDRLLSSRTSFSVAAKAALLIDLNTGRAVYEQDADERVYPASLTKIMTCLLALENGNLSDVVTVSASAGASSGSWAGVQPVACISASYRIISFTTSATVGDGAAFSGSKPKCSLRACLRQY